MKDKTHNPHSTRTLESVNLYASIYMHIRYPEERIITYVQPENGKESLHQPFWVKQVDDRKNNQQIDDTDSKQFKNPLLAYSA